MPRTLEELLGAGRTPRVVGFDDGPYDAVADRVPLCGVVCAGTRFDGMVWGSTGAAGEEVTPALIQLLGASKFADQVRAVLTDGLTMGGLGLVDLAALAEAAGVPAIAVMRRPPDLERFERSLRRYPDVEARLALVRRAGPIHERGGFVFQVVGAGDDTAARLLAALTDTGRVPEPLRLAHLVASAVATGQSGRRA